MPERRKRQHRQALRWFCVVIILLCLAGQARARQSLGANGPMAIAVSSPPAVDSPEISHATAAASAILLMPAPRGQDITSKSVNDLGNAAASKNSASAAKSAAETLPLGPPPQKNPVDVMDGEERGADLLEKFDPRKNEMTRVGGALAVVIGLLLLLRTFVRRGNVLAARGGRPSGVLEILARYPVSRGQQLVLLKLARRIVLLHQTGSTMTALCEISDADEVAALLGRMEAGASERDAAKFRSTLNEFIAQHEASHSRRGRVEPGATARIESEIVDLTRSRPRSLGGFLRIGGAR